MGSIDKPISDFDVVIVGAGISGINTGYRIQDEFPNYSYTILEARGQMGGTWDLFKYPGIRSDSDLHTFGFSWRPWSMPNAIAEGPAIKQYMKESAAMYGIDKHIQYHHKLISADWSSDTQQWNLSVVSNGESKIYRARFVVLGTGYYNYDTPLEAKIPGLDRFQGKVIHPQFWPEDLDYKNKKFVVIGSGATAVTLIPNLVDAGAEKVTMLQRSPTYIIPLAQSDPITRITRRILPSWLSQRITRARFLVLPFLFFRFCRAFPNAAKKLLTKAAQKQTPANVPVDPHFTPSYNPWEQRLCVCPDGDFYKSLRGGRADIVTDHIDTVTESGLVTKNGTTLDADIIVTATGLKLQMAGGACISVDGKAININDKFLWKGVMLNDVPNLAFVIGYTNASWTLGANTTAQICCRLLHRMDKNGETSCVPRVVPGSLKSRSPLNLNSTYIVKAKGSMPQAGDKAPFLPRENYLMDFPSATYGDLTRNMEFRKGTKKVA